MQLVPTLCHYVAGSLVTHLLPDNKLPNHRHTQTDRVSYAQRYK